MNRDMLAPVIFDEKPTMKPVVGDQYQLWWLPRHTASTYQALDAFWYPSGSLVFEGGIQDCVEAMQKDAVTQGVRDVLHLSSSDSFPAMATSGQIGTYVIVPIVSSVRTQ